MGSKDYRFDDLKKASEGKPRDAFLNEFLKHVCADSKVLELGSGSGLFSVDEDRFDLTLSDFSEEIVANLRMKSSSRVLRLDAREFQTPERYDGIVSLKLMHHFDKNEILTSFASQVSALNGGGILAHSVWNRDRLGDPSGHLSQAQWTGILERFGELVSIDSFSDMIADDTLGFILRVEG